VAQYALQTPWNPGTAVYISEADVTPYIPNPPTRIAVDTSGTFIYLSSSKNISQFQLTTPWDISTILPPITSVSLTKVLGITGLRFNNTGTKLYTLTMGHVIEHDLLTPWDLNSAQFSIGGMNAFVTPYTAAKSMVFKPDGTMVIILYSDNRTVRSYALSSPWDVDTVLPGTEQVFSISEHLSFPNGVAMSPDGSKLYVVADTGDRVHRYNLSTPWTITTASHTTSVSFTAQGSTPQSVAFNTDGSKMYLLDSSTQAVSQYSLSAAWDINTTSYTGRVFVSAHETAPRGFTFNYDGTRMYVTGFTSRQVHQYALATPWETGTAEHIGSLTADRIIGRPYGVGFNPSGDIMYLACYDGIIQYNLSAPWDVTSAQFVLFKDPAGPYKELLFTAGDEIFEGLSFSGDGLYMYVTDRVGENAQQYRLHTPWDVRSGVYTKNVSLRYGGTPDTTSKQLVFAPGGGIAYITSLGNKRIYTYGLEY
jgi:sugar lactone lactonase YvrE